MKKEMAKYELVESNLKMKPLIYQKYLESELFRYQKFWHVDSHL